MMTSIKVLCALFAPYYVHTYHCLTLLLTLRLIVFLLLLVKGFTRRATKPPRPFLLLKFVVFSLRHHRQQFSPTFINIQVSLCLFVLPKNPSQKNLKPIVVSHLES